MFTCYYGHVLYSAKDRLEKLKVMKDSKGTTRDKLFPPKDDAVFSVHKGVNDKLSDSPSPV